MNDDSLVGTMSSETEPRLTRKEWAQQVAREACGKYGHDYEVQVVRNVMGEELVVTVVCDTCGRLLKAVEA